MTTHVLQPSDRIQAIQHLLASIFASQRTLRVLAPEFKWTGLGNLLGDFGELVAIEAYRLTKAPPGSDGYDALTEDGRTVQIKANFAASQIGFRGQAEILLVLSIQDNGAWDELYFGPFEPVLSASRRSERDNKNAITVSKLRKLAHIHGTIRPETSSIRSAPAPSPEPGSDINIVSRDHI